MPPLSGQVVRYRFPISFYRGDIRRKSTRKNNRFLSNNARISICCVFKIGIYRNRYDRSRSSGSAIFEIGYLSRFDLENLDHLGCDRMAAGISVLILRSPTSQIREHFRGFVILVLLSKVAYARLNKSSQQTYMISNRICDA